MSFALLEGAWLRAVHQTGRPAEAARVVRCCHRTAAIHLL